MSTFNTHGGYFAPKDYMRIDTGGSHDENPNGGVQLGVDPEGVPNLLEEGEPVYKDYVFSDNIKADRKFLDENHLPSSYEGKLYSEIADDIVDEAEERPNDPISRNGLEAMLGRLAEAQEAQKMEEETRELEKMLSELTPEELDALEAQLSQDQFLESPEQGTPVEASPEMMVPEQETVDPMQAQMQPETVPVMARGGLLKQFYTGGDTNDPPYQAPLIFNPETGTASVAIPYAAQTVIEQPSVVTAQHPFSAGVTQAINDAGENIYNVARNVSYFTPAAPVVLGSESAANIIEGNTLEGLEKAGEAALAGTAGLVRNVQRFSKAASKSAKLAKQTTDAKTNLGKAKAARQTAKSNVGEKAADAVSKITREGPEAQSTLDALKELDKAKDGLQKARREVWGAYGDVIGAGLKKTGNAALNKAGYLVDPTKNYRRLLVTRPEIGTFGRVVRSLPQGITATAIDAALPVGLIVGATSKSSNGQMFSDKPVNISASGEPDVSAGFSARALGGPVNKFEPGGWMDFINKVRGYTASKNAGNTAGKYAIDPRFDLRGFKTLRDLENSDDYRAFTDYVLANFSDPNVQDYLKALDEGIVEADKLFVNGRLRDNWKDLYRDRRYDGDAGIYHLYDADLIGNTPSSSDTLDPAVITAERTAPKYREYNTLQSMMSDLYGNIPVTRPDLSGYYEEVPYEDLDESLPGGYAPSNQSSYTQPLPTFGRYAKGIGAGLLGAYNAFTPADHYTASRAVPYVPYGRINLQNTRYQAVDPNQIMNEQLAQANSTARGIRATVSPSTNAALLALDNNTNRNLGTGLLQTIQQNNQQRNAVIAQNNQAEAQRAQFDYAVDAARSQALNAAQQRNQQNELLLQRLNNEAEGQKYAALSNQINAGLDALAGIGQENFEMNQLNSNTALNGYSMVPDGTGGYKLVPRSQRADFGGLLKKYKK